MSELNKIIRTTQEVMDKVIAGTHESHTYNDNNMYQVELEDPVILGDDNSGASIDSNNKLIIDLRSIKLNGTAQTITSGAIDIVNATLGTAGLLYVTNARGLEFSSGTPRLQVSDATAANIPNRATQSSTGYGVITTSNYDRAVKEALTGTNGLTYTSDEQSAARTRLDVEKADSTILKQANVIDNVTSTSTIAPLSANQGTLLQAQIDNLKTIGRFLAILDASAGTVSSQPSTTVGYEYTYKVGDYYRVGTGGTYGPKSTLIFTVDSTSGSSNFESGSITYASGDVIFCSNVTSESTTWVKQSSGASGTVQDVQNPAGSTLVSSGVATIPYAGASTGNTGSANPGIVWANVTTESGISIDSNGKISVTPADAGDIGSTRNRSVTARYFPDYFKSYLVDSRLTLTDTQKAAARTLINAGIPNTTLINSETITTETAEVLTQSEFDAKATAGTLVKGVKYKIKGTPQEKLVSGTNIKTLNNQSLLGSGNININTAVWGNITGTLSSQTDLNNKLTSMTVTASETGTSTTEVSYLTIGSTEYKLAGGGSSTGAVRYDEAQSLTSAQKEQARANVGLTVVVLEDDD